VVGQPLRGEEHLDAGLIVMAIPLLRVLLSIFILECSWLTSRQNPQLETKNGHVFSTVIFSWVLWSARPPYFTVAVDSTGNATYESVPQSTQKTGTQYIEEFPVSAPIRDKIFRAVEQLNFLKLPSSASNNTPATASIKTLAFREENTYNEITYATPANPLIGQLTVLFQKLSATMEFGRRLADLHQQKSDGLEPELRQMQSMAQKGELEELPSVAPVLRDIEADATVDGNARARAKAILDMITPETQAGAR
jgi:hypothetical protein